MADEMTQSAVDTLLGQLTKLLVSEVQLLGGVRNDMQFIKDEMESMNGFLLDVGGEPSSNQVKAWRKQVREVAYDSQRCVDRYVQTMGPGRHHSAAGLLLLGRAPQLLQIRRIAKQIKDLKSRAHDIGERRQRYGVMAPPTTTTTTTSVAADQAKRAGRPTWQLQAEEARRRRRAIADAADWLEADARKMVDWLAGRPATADQGARPRNYLQRCSDAIAGFARTMWNAPSKVDQVAPELIKTVMALVGHDDPGNIEDAASLLWDYNIDIIKGERRVVVRLIDVLNHKIGLQRGGDKNKAVATSDINKAVATCSEDVFKTSSDPKEILMAQMQYSKQVGERLGRVVFPDLLKQLSPFQRGGGRFPRLLAIVTPPIDGHIIQDDALPVDKRATELALRVYQESLQACYFNCVVWINARELAEPRERLEKILQEARKQLPPLPPYDDHDDGPRAVTTLTQDELCQEIRDRLEAAEKFLIVLADHEDDAPWSGIIPALPRDFSDQSAILVTPTIRQTAQFHVWYMLSVMFTYLHKTARYKVHFYSHLAAARQKANELAPNVRRLPDLQATVKDILTKCRWDTFSTKMFLHALYANPHRSKDMLEKLLLGLNEFNTVSNAREMIKLCYDDLHSHYKTCLLYLSIFRPGFEIRRTCLVRRWAAEGLVTRRGRQTATDEAEQCFSELLDRGLLLPAGGTGPPTTKVKMCKVDPHVFSFITRMPREDDSADSTELPPAFARRLSIPSGIKLSKTKRPAAGWKKNNKECTAAADLQNSIDGMLNFLNLFPTTQLGWIKVLDLEGYNGLRKQHLKNICNKIFQLKYLSLRNTGVTELPKEIEKLQDLETFDIRQTKIKSFPTKSIVLPKLERLLANHSSNHDNGSCEEPFSTISIPPEIGSMTNIQILSHVQVSTAADEEALDGVVKLQQLRKLGVVIVGKVAKTHLIRVIGMLNESLYSLSVHITDDVDVDLTNRGPTFSAPGLLTSLKISGKIEGLPNWISDLQLLSKITLCRTSLTESDVNILGDLVNLCFISLSCASKNYLVFQKGFKKLEVLSIQDSNISNIIFQGKACPKLEKIVWTSNSTTCKLETLEVHKLPGLKEIEIRGFFDLPGIKKAVEKNQNNPKLKI